MSAAKFSKWEKITTRDYEAFIGFSILMAINSLPAIPHYWKDDITYRYRPVADRITFKKICRYLHYVDNKTLDKRGTPNYDRLAP